MRGMVLFAIAGALFAFMAMGVVAVLAEPAGETPPAPELPGPAESPTKEITIGSCPTLEEDASTIAEKIPGASLVVFGSTAEALEALRAGEIDVALVGRVASPYELPEGTEEVRLKEGYTLVSKSKATIEYSELCSIEVCTCLPREAVEEMLPPCANVSFYPDAESALGCSAVLIEWKEYSQGQELLIPVENGKKVKKFRAVVAYFPSSLRGSVSGILG